MFLFSGKSLALDVWPSGRKTPFRWPPYYFPSINQDGSDFTVNGFLVGEVRLVYLVECLLSLCMVKVD
jgi:hypothetical protein